MDQMGYLILAICILVALLVVFFVSFILYRKTPVPKGCEQMKINKENCASCTNSICSFYQKDEESK